MAADWTTVMSLLAAGAGLAGLGVTRLRVSVRARSRQRSVDVLVELGARSFNDPATLDEELRE